MTLFSYLLSKFIHTSSSVLYIKTFTKRVVYQQITYIITRPRQASVTLVSKYTTLYFISGTIFIPIAAFDILRELDENHNMPLIKHFDPLKICCWEPTYVSQKYISSNSPLPFRTCVHPFIPLSPLISFHIIYIKADKNKKRKS